MQKDDFKIFLGDLCNYLVHKDPPAESKRLWFESCQKIPAEALTWINANQFRELEGFPKNFVKWLWAMYHLWLEANPEKKARKEKLGCEQCHEGYILVSRYDDRVKYRGDVLFRCGNCNQDGPRAIPAKTRYELLEGGYCKPVGGAIFKPYHKVFNDPPADEPELKKWDAPAWIVPEMPVPEEGPQPIAANDLPF